MEKWPVIAHEINNPLAIIQGKASLLLKLIRSRKFNTETGTAHLAVIIKTTERISKIIIGLKSFSRNGDKDHMILTETSVMLENVFNLCADKFKSNNVKLEIKTAPTLNLLCRSVQLEQVLVNLLGNACDAVSSLPEKWVQIDFRVTADQLQILVTDSGKGIAPDVLEKMMQPFFTTKEIGKGTGLGLSISKSIIEDHHGCLLYDATSPNTCFVIELPLESQNILEKKAA